MEKIELWLMSADLLPTNLLTCNKCLKILCFLALLVPFFRSRQPNRKKVPKMASQGPSGTLPGTRQEGEIGLLFALGAFQGRIWSQNGTPKGTPNHSKISLRAQGPPRARPGLAQRPPESLSGGMLGSFWLQFGPSGAHVRAFSGCTFASFGLLLVYCWCSFSLASSPPLLAF